MNLIVSLYVALLFFVLTPGILVSLPPKGSKMVVALTHAVVFAVVFHFTNKMVFHASMRMTRQEGMSHDMKKKEHETM